MSQATRRRPLVALILLLAAGAGCAGGDRFDASNARAHVQRLAGSIGSRPAGSAANEKARAYLIETLQLYGFDVRVQEADATWPEAGVNARVSNIIAVKPGQQEEAIGLVAHYDSVPYGPGAGDDAFGTAVVLEAARVLAARESSRHSLLVLLTDGEEHGLMGARALVEDPEVRSRLKAFVNIEAIGTAGPLVLFESGPGTSPALRAWAASSRPRGGSYMQSVYDALPNDTDFTLLKEIPGASGINLAAVGDGYSYHTDRDRADRLDPGLLARAGSTVLEVVDGLESRPTLEPAPAQAIYFSVLDRTAFMVSRGTGIVLGGIAVMGALLAWAALARRMLGVGGPKRLVLTLAWATVAAGAVLGALVAAVWLVRVARAQLHPWFASPLALFAFMTVMVVAISWGVRRVAAAAPQRLQPEGTPFGVWFATLPPWIGLAIAALVYAPAASYLLTVPLAVAALLLPLGLWRPSGARLASVVVLVVTWVLWVPDLVTLLGFAVTALERFPIVTPTWVYPALLFAAGIVIWPPALATMVGRIRWRLRHGLAAAILMVALVVTGLVAFTSSAYTEERPLQRTAAFVDDRVQGTAHWEISSNEPGVDIAAGGPANMQWHPVTGASLSARIGVRTKAHVFGGTVPAPGGALPFTVSATVTRRPGDADIEITVSATDDTWQRVAFVLPDAVVPTRSSLVGRTRDGHWQAVSATLPRGGLTWRATVPASQADRLAATEIRVSSTRLPGHTGASPLPAWLQTPRTAWQTRHTIVTGITPTDVDQPVAAEPGTSRFAPTPLGKVHYLDRGTGDAALVFLHDWGGAASVWRQQAALSAAHRTVLVDLPGHGRSEAPAAAYDVASLATSMRAVLDAAGVQRAVIVGHGIGALVGWHLAVQQPARVVGIVAVDGTLLPPAAGTVPQPPSDDAVVAAALPSLFTAATPHAVRNEVTSLVQRTPSRVMAGLLRDVSSPAPFTPGAYPEPVLVLATTGTSPDHEGSLRSRFAQLDYRHIDAGHFLMLERPREVEDAIAGFLLGRGLLR